MPPARTASPSPAAKDPATEEKKTDEAKKGGVFGPKMVIAVVALAAGAYFLKSQVNMSEAMESAILYIEAQGENAMRLYLLFTFIGVVCLIPTTPMEFAGGFLFGPTYGLFTTWALTSIAKLCANVVCVWMARNLLKDWVMKTFVEKNDLLKMVSSAVKDEPFKMAFLVRGSMVPLAVKNYGLGVMDIGYFPIAACSCIFTPFYAFQNIYLGGACQDLKDVFSPKKPSAADEGWFGTAKALMPIFFQVLLIVVIFRAVKSQMKKQNAVMQEKMNKDKPGEEKKEAKKGK